VQQRSKRQELSTIHIVIVVFGEVYSKLLADITLCNLTALVREVPETLRANSKVRIFTTAADVSIIESARAIRALRQLIHVDLISSVKMDGFEIHGGYGPMVVAQREAVKQAAREGAAIFFVGPDQIYSKGSFRYLLERLNQGYRVLIGPGLRVKRNAVRATLVASIEKSEDCTFALEPKDQIELFFDHWHPINDQFVMGSMIDMWWKAYIYYRPHPDHMLIRFLQGPTLVAWPNRPIEDFDGFIDHSLILRCCATWREVYVVPDASNCLALDMTGDGRFDEAPLAKLPAVDFLRQLFNREGINEFQLISAFRSCRISRQPSGHQHQSVRRWEADLQKAVDPLLMLAIAERRLDRVIGSKLAKLLRAGMLITQLTFRSLFGILVRRVVTKYRDPQPLSGLEDRIRSA
jgi:hypothetical protein